MSRTMDAILGRSGDDNTDLSGAQPGQPVATTANNDGKTTPAGTAVAEEGNPNLYGNDKQVNYSEGTVNGGQAGTSSVVQDGEVNAADFNKFEEESLARNIPESEAREARKKSEMDEATLQRRLNGVDASMEDLGRIEKGAAREGKKKGKTVTSTSTDKTTTSMPSDLVLPKGTRRELVDTPDVTALDQPTIHDAIDRGEQTPAAVSSEDLSNHDKVYQFVGDSRRYGTAPSTATSIYDDALKEEQELDRRRKLTYEEMMSGLDRELEKINLETPEEKKKREKRERARRVIAAIGDGISALSNLYFTTKGGPNMYEKNTLSDRTRASIERLKAEREADQARHLQLSAKKYGLIDDLLKEKRTARKLQTELQLKAEKAEKDAMLAEARARLYESQGSNYAALAERQNAQALKAQAEAARAQAQAEWVPKVQSAQVNKLNQQAGAASASASLAMTRAAHVGSGGGGGGGRGGGSKGPKPVGTIAGTPYFSANDYNVGVEEQAERYGVPTTEERVTTNQYGETTRKTVKRKNPAVVKDINKVAKQQQQQRQQPARGATPKKPGGNSGNWNFSIRK